jgi:RNA polymerase sigma factor (sigma-70 family)
LGQCRDEIVAWVGSNIIPHEADLRLWLGRMSASPDEINDIVQDAYLAIARLDSVAHIRNPRTYLFQTAKNAVLARLRRERIVRIELIGEVELLDIADTQADPERRTGARMELERVRRLIAALPDRCRQIFELRRIQGVPQKEIARLLGLPEHIVEAQAVRGLKLILKAIATEDASSEVARKGVWEADRGTTRKR